MTRLRRWPILRHFFVNRGDAEHVSAECCLAMRYRESTRGVDLPAWRFPAEIEQMRCEQDRTETA